MSHDEESAPLLMLDQQSIGRPSTELYRVPPATPSNDNDDGSSKESDSFHDPAPEPGLASYNRSTWASDGLPVPITASRDRAVGLIKHVALVLPRFVLLIVWFCAFLTFCGASILYLMWWTLLQLAMCFTRADVDRSMVRRDLGCLFETLLDLFERIW